MRAILDHALDLTWLAAVLLISVAIGRRACRAARWEFPALAERISLAAGIGLALLSYLVFLAGIAGFLTPRLLWGILAVLALAGATEWPRGWRALRATLGAVRRQTQRRFAAVLVAVVFVQVAVILLKNLAPPSAADPLYYHLTVPRQYLYEGEIVWWPVFGWNLPQLTEMLYTLGLGTRGDIAAASFGTVWAVVCLVAVWSLARRFVSRSGAWLAAGLCVTLPAFYTYATDVKVELPLIAYFMLGWLGLLHWLGGGGHRWLVLVGLCGGLAASTKYQGLFALGTLSVATLVALVWRPERLVEHRRGLLVSLGFAVAAALVVMLPWYGRNWWFGGDPVWPLGFPVFGTRYYSAQEYLKFASWEVGSGDSLWAFLLGPWSLTVYASSFGTQDFRTVFTPLFLAFLPGLVLVWRGLSSRIRPGAVLLLVGVGTAYVLWFSSGYKKLSYLLPLLLPLIPLLALVVHDLWGRSEPLRAVMTCALAFALCLGLATALLQSTAVFGYLAGRIDRDTYLGDRVSYYADLQWANRNLPADARVLSLDLHPFYLERRMVSGAPAYSGVLDYPSIRSPQEFLARLKSKGFTHILAPVRPLPETFAKASRELWTDTDLGKLIQALADEGRIIELYHNGNARVIQSRTFGWERPSEYFIYELRYADLRRARG